MFKTWLVTGGVALLVALGSLLTRPRDIPWVKHLERPKWLFFEPAIPFIWSAIFTSGSISAALIWEKDPGSFKTWLLMGLYLLVETITVAYIPATLRLRSLKVGTILGSIGVVTGIILGLLVLPISKLAALLLVPYLIWTPIGTYTTGQMIDLNPDAA